MANWWGGMSGAQAVEMGMNIFNASQQQMLLKQQQEQQQKQQVIENFFMRQKLDLEKGQLDLQKARQDLELDQAKKELEQRESEFARTLVFKEKALTEESRLERERMTERLKLTQQKAQQEKPNLAEYPSAIKQAMDLYEETGNWGIVQATQKQYGIPVGKAPDKVKELKDAASVWQVAEEKGLPLIVDRKLGMGGEEMTLPIEIVNKYGAKVLDALSDLGKGRMDGILGADKYSKYSISQIYDIYFRAKKFKQSGKSKEEIANKMQESGINEDLIKDIMELL